MLVCVSTFPERSLETAHLCNDHGLDVKLTLLHYLYSLLNTQANVHTHNVINYTLLHEMVYIIQSSETDTQTCMCVLSEHLCTIHYVKHTAMGGKKLREDEQQAAIFIQKPIYRATSSR